MKRISRMELYMGVSKLFSQRGSCRRLQVGCTIVKEGRIICSGYNGAVGTQNCESHCNVNEPCTRAIHAEANAIAFAAKNGIALDGSTLYCTHSPCQKCAELIVQSGISQVIYEKAFRDTSGILFLKTNSIPVNRYEAQPVQDNNQDLRCGEGC